MDVHAKPSKRMKTADDAEQQATNDAEQQATNDAEKQATNDAEEKAKEDAEQKAKEEADQKAKEDAERQILNYNRRQMALSEKPEEREYCLWEGKREWDRDTLVCEYSWSPWTDSDSDAVHPERDPNHVASPTL